MKKAGSRSPPMKTSDEATRSQLAMARAQGAAFGRALKHMTGKVADDGGEQPAGDYLVGFAVEKAEGMWMPGKGGKLSWHAPDRDNLHVEVSVRDRGDGRFVPGLVVHATLIAPGGKKVGTHRQPFIWHPWLYHYGRNWKVPADGTYILRVRIDPPVFHRHDEKNGKRYAEAVSVEFKSVKITTGRES